MITLDQAFITNLLQALILVVFGWLVAKFVTGLIGRTLQTRLDRHQLTLVKRLVYWGILALVAASALHQLGFQLGILLGAAGILTVALGFASQTSAANIISGLFVIGERSVSVGDVITVGSTTGEVLSIDWLSIKLRTFDNLFVRIPNESFVKSEVTNLTRFPIRRADIQVGIAYHEDIAEARTVLMQVAVNNPLCLMQPEPIIILRGFGDSSINLQFSVWALRENFLAMRNSMQEEIKTAFDSAGIEIPFPHRTLYIGEKSLPLPLTQVDKQQVEDHE